MTSDGRGCNLMRSMNGNGMRELVFCEQKEKRNSQGEEFSTLKQTARKRT